MGVNEPDLELTIRKEVVVKASSEQVWSSWTTAKGFKDFFGTECDIVLEIGGRFEIYFDPSAVEGERGTEGCKVLSYLPERMLSFTWNAPPSFPELRNKHTWVVLEFKDTETGVELTLNHLGWRPDGRWPELRGYFDRNWTIVLNALVAHFGPEGTASAQSGSCCSE